MSSLCDSSDIARPAYRFKHRAGQRSLALYNATIRTSLGPRLLTPSPSLRLTRRELDSLIRGIDRDAVEAQEAGRFEEADRLAVRAAILRDAAR